MNIKSISLEISCFKLIIALVIGVLFISQYVPAYADHFTEAEIEKGTASIEQEFQEGLIDKEEYIEKMPTTPRTKTQSIKIKSKALIFWKKVN